MGVPKFFRWISERYPLIVTPVAIDDGLEFDNLYLDFNGVIHSCVRTNDGGFYSERQMILNIYAYIDLLFEATRPRKLLYVAVDGVAPRAKMNQQRSRRFRSAKDAQIALETRIKAGDEIPDTVFDSNAITPGTEFMDNLTEHLKYYFIHKLNTDSRWKSLEIVLSGCEVPGEGEHKVMDYIRRLKAQPDYTSSTRHCLYGLDADLIFLTLITHEPNFSLLREEVVFGPKPASHDSFNPRLQFLHISLVRDYLTADFEYIKPLLSFEFSTDRLVDDFSLICLMVGNDFVPALPTLDIAESSLDLALKVYGEILPTLDGYLHFAGKVNWKRFGVFLRALSGHERSELMKKIDMERKFRSSNKKIKMTDFDLEVDSLIGKLSRGDHITINDPMSEEEVVPDEFEEVSDDQDVVDPVVVTKPNTLMYFSSSDDDENESESSETEEEGDQQKTDQSQSWIEVGAKPSYKGFGTKNFMVSLKKEDDSYKFSYYIDKFAISSVEDYFSAVIWVLGYYYTGVIDWSWYYPYHYAPLLSDLSDYLERNDYHVKNLKFSLGEPFLPLEQLVAVLPRASKALLPKVYADLIDKNGPLFKYYPDDFEIDMNGKKNDWEGQVFESAFDKVNLSQLTDQEKARNSRGTAYIFTCEERVTDSLFSSNSTQTPPEGSDDWLVPFQNRKAFMYPFNHFDYPHHVSSDGVVIDRNDILSGFRFNPIIHPKANLHSLFPTLYGSNINFESKLADKPTVQVFKMPSRKTSVLIKVFGNSSNAEFLDNVSSIQATALSKYLGKIVYIGWPHVRPALVERIMDKNSTISLDSAGNCLVNPSNPAEFDSSWRSIEAVLLKRWGLALDNDVAKVLVFTRRAKRAQKDDVGAYVFDRRSVPSPWVFLLTELSSHYNYVEETSFLKPLLTDSSKRKLNEVDIDEFGICLRKNTHFFGNLVSLKSLTTDNSKLLVNVTVHLPPPVPKSKSGFINGYLPKYSNLFQAARKQLPLFFVPWGKACHMLKMSYNALNRVCGRLSTDAGVKVGLHIKNHFTCSRAPHYCDFVFTDKGIDWKLSNLAIDLLKEYQRVFPELFRFLQRNPKANDVPTKQLFPPKETKANRIKEIMPFLGSKSLSFKWPEDSPVL
ncbi:hypothetical protein GEMRC1_003578 [Eukaryota sp. GEM-RC1]